ncbi:MAG TPA: NADP-dependent oxidoreductase [Solirubrobacteraceae bacterium]|nr:NADP-dependent oxidoreductase [Solirubrobacteraceae bacterium]
MRAVALRRFGGPEVLEVLELQAPAPGEGEVRVRVAAATVNPTDIGLRTGAFAERYRELPPPWIPGMELAGEIDAVGPGSDWAVGERVIAIVLPSRPLGGAQAEQVVVPAVWVAPAPAGASLEEAATLPMNGLTARLALDTLALAPGATLAVTGAAGAVGGYAIELGRREGLTIVADAAPADEALVRGLGADVVVPRGEAGTATAIREAFADGVDAVIDAALLGPAILPALRDGGKLIAVRPFAGETERGIAIELVLVSDYAANQQALRELARQAGAGELTLRVAETFAPERAADAHRALEAGGVRGRLVITF